MKVFQRKTVGDDVFGSTINGTGSFVMEVSKDSSDTVFAKILKLVDQSQKNLSKTATTIKRLEPKYVTLVLMIFHLYWSWVQQFWMELECNFISKYCIFNFIFTLRISS